MIEVKNTSLRYLALSCLIIPFLYLVWLIIRIFIMDYFTIPTESMMPTLQPGDKVIVNKLTMGARLYADLHFDIKGQELKAVRTKGLRRLKHNDIVVFNLANHNDKISFIINNVYCKRIIGLPGDSVSAVNGKYRNNNHRGMLCIQESQHGLENTPDSLIPCGFWIPPYYSLGWNIKNFGPYYVPRRGDVMKLSAKEGAVYKPLLEWEIGTSISWNWDKNETYSNGKVIRYHTFKHDFYFMAGDNVINSNDSRYWGLVPEEYIVGVVDKIIRDGKMINPYIASDDR